MLYYIICKITPHDFQPHWFTKPSWFGHLWLQGSHSFCSVHLQVCNISKSNVTHLTIRRSSHSMFMSLSILVSWHMRIPKLIFEVLMETIHFLWHRAVNKHLSESNSKTEHFSSSVWDLEVIFTIPWDSSMNKFASIRVWCIAALRAWCNSWRRIWIAVAAAVSEIRISLSHASARRTTSVTTSTDRHIRWTPTGNSVGWHGNQLNLAAPTARGVVHVSGSDGLPGGKKNQRYQPTEHDMTCGPAWHLIYWLRFIWSFYVASRGQKHLHWDPNQRLVAAPAPGAFQVDVKNTNTHYVFPGAWHLNIFWVYMLPGEA